MITRHLAKALNREQQELGACGGKENVNRSSSEEDLNAEHPWASTTPCLGSSYSLAVYLCIGVIRDLNACGALQAVRVDDRYG